MLLVLVERVVVAADWKLCEERRRLLRSFVLRPAEVGVRGTSPMPPLSAAIIALTSLPEDWLTRLREDFGVEGVPVRGVVSGFSGIFPNEVIKSETLILLGAGFLLPPLLDLFIWSRSKVLELLN